MMRICATVVAGLVMAQGALAQQGSVLGLQITDSLVTPPGAYVATVTPGGDAESAPIYEGDVITGLDGQPVTSAAVLRRLLAQHKAGQPVRITLAHPGGRQVQFTMTPREASQTPASTERAASQNAPAAIAPAAPSVRWATFSDPVEHAFTIELPAGWSARGGVRRMSAVEVRAWAAATSPDGSIELFFGDPDVPIYTQPSPLLRAGGFHEGMVYSPGYGQQFVVMAYRAGAAFASEWGSGRIGKGCGGVTAIGARPLPQATRQIDMAYAAGGVRTHIEAGEANFDCTQRGIPAKGYVFAATELVETQGSALWNVKVLAGFIASAARAPDAAALLSHAVASFRIDEAWAARASATAAKVSQIVTETNKVVSESIREPFEAMGAAHDRTRTGFGEATLGVRTYVDPNTHERRTMPNSAERVWVCTGNRWVPTATSQAPETGCTEAQVVPPGR